MFIFAEVLLLLLLNLQGLFIVASFIQHMWDVAAYNRRHETTRMKLDRLLRLKMIYI